MARSDEKKPDYRLKYILVARSGCGKSTMAGILEQELGLRRCVTSTTRPPRKGEVDGVDYHFLKEMDRSRMFESAQFGGFWYGTSWDELCKGDFIILEPQGVAYYRTHFPAPLTVIQLERSGIQVDAARMARDAGAGFDAVRPDIIVQGDSTVEMSKELIREILKGRCPPLDERISAARKKTGKKSSGTKEPDLSLV